MHLQVPCTDKDASWSLKASHIFMVFLHKKAVSCSTLLVLKLSVNLTSPRTSC